MSVQGIHHINFVVAHLETAIKAYQEQLGIDEFIVIDHPTRGARIARAKLRNVWFVLVEPYDADSVPGRHLAEHGEGFFLLSFEDSSSRDEGDAAQEWRDGILNWAVRDLGEIAGAKIQLTRER